VTGENRSPQKCFKGKVAMFFIIFKSQISILSPQITTHAFRFTSHQSLITSHDTGGVPWDAAHKPKRSK
jgi:hypothetical protein